MSEKNSLHQRVRNCAASQAVENVKARHSYLHAKAFGTEEWGELWSRREDVSWAHSFGRMRGFEEVWFNSVTLYDAQAYESYLQLYLLFPEIGGYDPRPLMECAMHMLATDIIEVARDGQSARSYYLTPGYMFCNLNPDKKKSSCYLWERYGADFVLEDGEWLYLHEQVCPDIMGDFDSTNWGEDAYNMLVSPPEHLPPPPGAGGAKSHLRVTDPGPLHQRYGLLQPPQDTVPWPEPYETLDDNNSYTVPVLSLKGR